jgi:hypothetical protein
MKVLIPLKGSSRLGVYGPAGSMPLGCLIDKLCFPKKRRDCSKVLDRGKTRATRPQEYLQAADGQLSLPLCRRHLAGRMRQHDWPAFRNRGGRDQGRLDLPLSRRAHRDTEQDGRRRCVRPGHRRLGRRLQEGAQASKGKVPQQLEDLCQACAAHTL